MKRVGGLWPRVVAFDELLRAAHRAARGKRQLAAVAEFMMRLEPECLQLQRELRSGQYRPGTPTTFIILDPKERTITAAPFRDRVVHHALMAALEPVFDRRMLPESFACRRGKGTHAALRHARRLVRRYAWFLKLDIRKCFESLDHNVVIETVGRLVKDRRVLALCETIVRAHPADPAVPGVGLPIGNLPSQWQANLVLDRLDHHVKEVLRIPGYVRYTDDFGLFADDRATLRAALADVGRFVEGVLHLRLKERGTILAPVRDGFPFLGWRIYRHTTRLRPQNLRRTRRRLRHRCWEHRTGRISEEKLADCVRAFTAHLEHGTTRPLRRSWLDGAAPFLAREPPVQQAT